MVLFFCPLARSLGARVTGSEFSRVHFIPFQQVPRRAPNRRPEWRSKAACMAAPLCWLACPTCCMRLPRVEHFEHLPGRTCWLISWPVQLRQRWWCQQRLPSCKAWTPTPHCGAIPRRATSCDTGPCMHCIMWQRAGGHHAGVYIKSDVVHESR